MLLRTLAKQKQLGFYSSEQKHLFYDDVLTQEGNVDECMQDVLTALYYTRMLPLKVGVENIFWMTVPWIFILAFKG
jgi:hypothetical protein